MPWLLSLLLALAPWESETRAAVSGPPFGLEAGSGREQVEAVLGPLAEVEPSVYLLAEVSGDLPHVENLTLVITPNQGLCRVQAGTALFPTDPAGAEVRRRFASLRERLETLYGEPNVLDASASADAGSSGFRHENGDPEPEEPSSEDPRSSPSPDDSGLVGARALGLDPQTVDDEESGSEAETDPGDDSWMEGLKARRNALLAVWSGAEAPLGHNLESITLAARALEANEAFLTVDYVYTIWDYCRPALAGEEAP